MCFYKIFGYRLSLSAALYFCSRHSEITVEYALMIARVDSLPKVLYIDFEHIDVLVSDDNYASVFFGITYGVAYKYC